MSCMMMEAEMYGITFSAKIAMRSTAPPDIMLNMPNTPWDCCWKASANCAGSMPGTGTKVPTR